MSSFDEESLYELEKKLIEKHPKFNGIKPRPIILVDMDAKGRALQDKIEIDRGFFEMNPSQRDVEALLKHELLHYVYTGQGHSIEFLNDAVEMGILDDIDRRQLINELNQTRLEGRVFYQPDENGEAYIIRDKPSWECFKQTSEEFLERSAMASSELLRRLREGYQMPISEAAESIGISEEELKRVEENKDLMILYLEEDLLKKIFMGIISASERWKDT